MTAPQSESAQADREWILKASERLGSLTTAVTDLGESQTKANKQVHARIWRVEKAVDKLTETVQKRCDDCDAKVRLDKHEANHKDNCEKKVEAKRWYRDYRVQWWIAVFTSLGFGAAVIAIIIVH